jgi:hypothetical protein
MRYVLLSGVLALCACSTVFVAAHAAGDAPTSIAVGETGTSGRVEQDAAIALGTALSRAIASRDDVRLSLDPSRARYVVRGSVTRLEEREVEDGLEVRCEVSLIVAEARGGQVRAMLSGRAGARGIDDGERLAQAALDAAVRGALRPLGSQLR